MRSIKNKINFLIVSTVLLMMIGATASSVTASPFPPESLVSIEFVEGDANIGPFDPEEPDTPGNGGTGESGSLALNSVSNFYFEKEEILLHVADYPTTTQTPFIQVTDARGTAEGWSVSARASKFKTDKGKESLFGASMTLKNASCISPQGLLPPPQPKAEVTLNFDGEGLVEVVTAKADAGMGTWLTRWYTDPDAELNYSAVLTVPGGAALKGENTAKITWILSAAPV